MVLPCSADAGVCSVGHLKLWCTSFRRKSNMSGFLTSNISEKWFSTFRLLLTMSLCQCKPCAMYGLVALSSPSLSTARATHTSQLEAVRYSIISGVRYWRHLWRGVFNGTWDMWIYVVWMPTRVVGRAADESGTCGITTRHRCNHTPLNTVFRSIWCNLFISIGGLRR